MKRPNESELLYVEIPEELDAAILRGVQNGKRIMNRKRYVQRTVAGAAAVFAIFVGSIVVRLKEGEFVGQNVYSLRTLSMDQDALTKAQKDFPGAL